MNNKTNKEKKITTEEVQANARLLEMSLESFGIYSKVVEVNVVEDGILYSLEIAVGIKLNDLVFLNKDIALVLASSTGNVEIEAPIPGTSLIGIKVPLKSELKLKPENYQIIRIKEKESLKSENVLQTGLKLLIRFFAYALEWFADKLRRIENRI